MCLNRRFHPRSAWYSSSMATASTKDRHNSTLELVHIIFRHGDRTNLASATYPTDPHKNELYYPFGLGELTNKGKQKAFKLGQLLRRRYDGFISRIFTPPIIEARSSDSNRTKNSLQLVLAGLFQPVGELIWNEHLFWQPIPFTYTPRSFDKLFYSIFCPNYKKFIVEVRKAPQYVEELKKNKALYVYLTEHTGKVIKDPEDIFLLYVGLLSQEEFGLKLPSWTNCVYPEPLREIASRNYLSNMKTRELKQLGAGFLLAKIINDSVRKFENLTNNPVKMFLYSGHEFNLAFLMITLGVFEAHIPPYCSYLALECHRINGVNGIKIDATVPYSLSNLISRCTMKIIHQQSLCILLFLPVMNFALWIPSLTYTKRSYRTKTHVDSNHISPASSTVHIHEHYKSSDAVKTGDDNTIVQLHVLFRHGERTPNSPQSESYPKDPYINATYYPVGWGQLTNVGKRTEYRIGETLRQRYDSFLGDLVFPPSMLEARSTDYNRTKASLELVLASLYPPRSLQNWKFNLDWQPIPYNYYPTHHDKELFGIYCPQYLKDYDDLINSQRMQQELAKYKDTFQYIQENSGKNITIFEDVYDMGFGFSAEELWGFKLPKWTEKIWPDVVMNISIKQYYVYMGTPDLRKMASGYHMKKILHDIDGIVNNTKDQAKIHLYSAHENNIGQLLIYMGVFDNTFPDYGSFVTIEVHKLNNQYSIRVLYDNRSESGSPKVLKVCGTDVCSLEKFKSKFENYLPDDSLCGA